MHHEPSAEAQVEGNTFLKLSLLRALPPPLLSFLLFLPLLLIPAALGSLARSNGLKQHR